MHDLNDLFYFAKVVEAGGFAAAGRTLGIPKSRLSRRIAELENRLGARLLQRTPRKLSLTDIGERYLRHCQAMLQEAEQAEETVASLTSEPRGRLRVSAPGGIALAAARQDQHARRSCCTACARSPGGGPQDSSALAARERARAGGCAGSTPGHRRFQRTQTRGHGRPGLYYAPRAPVPG